MRKILLPAIALLLVIGCNTKPKVTIAEVKATESQKEPPPPPPPVNPLEKLLGSFVGPFGDNKITMLIIKVMNDSVEGRTIVGGNDRPFTGTYTEHNGVYAFAAKEPGDHPDDGVFNFSIRSDSNDLVTGSWKPNNPKKPVNE